MLGRLCCCWSRLGTSEPAMAEKRKLQLEMDKVFKKVDEGVDDFQLTLNKMQEANSENQRDKFQDELKRDMKKLQRLRDSIKTWQQSPEVKDKNKLAVYRRLIEERMEQFKDIERESKTKPHSKLGLQAADKIDPVEKERTDTVEFLQSAISRLHDQSEVLETELEGLDEAAEGGRKARAQAKETEEAINARLTRHKHHIHNLELVMRFVNNESLHASAAIAIKDDIEDYISRNDEDDFQENELMYEDLELEDRAKELGSVTAIGTLEEVPLEHVLATAVSSEPGTTPSAANSSSGSPNDPSSKTESERDRGSDDKVRGRRRRKPRTPNSNTGAGEERPSGGSGGKTGRGWTSTRRSSAHSLSPVSKSLPSTPAAKERPRPAFVGKTILPPLPPHLPSSNTLWTESSLPPSAALPLENTVVAVVHEPPPAPLPPSPSKDVLSSELDFSASEQSASASSSSHLLEARTDIVASLAQGNVPPLRAMAEQAVPKRTSVLTEEFGLAAGLNGSPVEEEEVEMALLSPPARPQLQSKAVTRPSKATGGKAPTGPSALRPEGWEMSEATSGPVARTEGVDGGLGVGEEEEWAETQEAFILPMQGASPLVPLESLEAAATFQRSEEVQQRLELLEAAAGRLPLAMDSERLRPHLLRYQTAQSPPHYPRSPPARADAPEYYERLNPETLFFIFYYMEGTRAQYLAAKALKALSWRFHKKYLVWFQRLEDPSYISEEYEEGTYIYFDYEKWAQRKKESFTFEYQYLEDQELV